MRQICYRTLAFLALCFLFLSAIAFAVCQIFFFSADFENAEYDLDSRVPEDALYFKGYDDTPYSDSFYYQFDSSDGSDFYCHMFFMDGGFGLKTYGLDYKLTCADGSKVYFGRKFDVDESSFASDRFELNMGPNFVKGDHNLHHLHIVSGPLFIDVKLKTEVPFYRPGEDGMMYVEDNREKVSQYNHFPLFSAKGKIRHGSIVIDVNGWGYGNRVWAKNVIGTEISEFHTALRWHKDGLGFDMYDYITTEKYGEEWLPYLLVYDKGKIVQVSQSYKKENLEYYTEPRSGRVIPTSYRVISESGDIKVTIEFTRVKITDYNDPLIVLNRIEKYLVQLISEAPLDLRFDGHVKMTFTTPDGTIIKQGPGHGLSLVTP